MKSHNPNRELSADEVVALFATKLPSLLDGLGADRKWLWWSGEKPDEPTRKTMLEIGFSFTPRAHTLPDGRMAYWFHACSNPVIRRGRNRTVSTRQHPGAKPEKSTRTAEKPSDAFAELQRIAHALT